MIQLDPEQVPGPPKFVGRVEHVDSGQADEFRSVEELARFIEQTLAEIKRQEEGDAPSN